MAANIHCLLIHFWGLWEEQSPSWIRNCLDPPVNTQALSGSDWCIHIAHNLAETSLVPKWLCCYWNWNKFHGVSSAWRAGFSPGRLFCSVMCECVFVSCRGLNLVASATRQPETRLGQSKREMRCALSMHHLCEEGSGMGCLWELCLLQGACSIAWKAAWRWNCHVGNTDAQFLVPGVK